MEKIIQLNYVNNFELWIQFNDGYSKNVNLKPYIGKGISQALLDIDYFKQVKVDEHGGLTWPNGYDICPNFLKDFSNS